MNNNADKKIDEFTEKLLKDFSRETPSFDFTTKVMSSVEGLSSSTATIYKPLISKRWWLFFTILITGAFMYLIFGNVETEGGAWVTAKAFDLLPKISSITLPDYQVSNVFLYGVLGFAFFVSIQVFVLKNHFNRRFV